MVINLKDNTMKTEWIKLTSDDLKMVLAQDEIDKLDSMSLSPEKIDLIIQETLDNVSNAFRGSWISKGYEVDIRDCYIDKAYKIYVLNLARIQIWSRFPNSKEIAIDEIREKMYDEAKELLKDPYIGVSKPDYSNTELSAEFIDKESDMAITIPFQRITSTVSYGFPQAYIRQFDYYNK